MSIYLLAQKHTKLLICLLLAIGTVATYWQTIGNGFVNIDDQIYITENTPVRAGLSWSGAAWAFTTGQAANWHPVTWLSHMLDCQIYGIQPWGHHLTNLIFHVLNVLLLFLLLSRMTGFVWRSAFVAALFAVHPMHVESVAWAAERKDVLSALFWILATLAYTRYVQKPDSKRYVLVAALLALGLMSKPMLVTLPLTLLLLDYWPLGRYKDGATSFRSLLIEKVPMFALVVASSVVTFLVQRGGGATSSLHQIPMPMRFANALVSYVEYIIKMFWPTRLAVMYPFPEKGISAGHIAGAAVLLVGLTFLASKAGRRRPYLLVGWLWYVLTLVPVIGLIQVGNQSMADRYSYIPFVGLFVCLAWGISDVAELHWPRLAPRLLAIPAFAVLIALIPVSWIQVGRWRDNVSLFSQAIAVTSDNFVAYNGLGYALAEQGKAARAREYYLRALDIKPGYTDALCNLGRGLEKSGKLEDAADTYREALRSNPRSAVCHSNLGVVLDKQQHEGEAISEFREAIRLAPELAPPHFNMGAMLSRQGKTGEAVNAYLEGLRLNPYSAPAHCQLAVVLLKSGRTKEAMAHFSTSLTLDPRLAAAHRDFGNALTKQGHLDEAMAQYSQSAKLDPKSADSHYNLGFALMNQGKIPEATAEYERALQIDPHHTSAHNNLAIMLYSQRKFAEAWQQVRLSRRYGGKPNPEFLSALSKMMPEPRN